VRRIETRVRGAIAEAPFERAPDRIRLARSHQTFSGGPLQVVA
jgi:hypothetical protein